MVEDEKVYDVPAAESEQVKVEDLPELETVEGSVEGLTVPEREEDARREGYRETAGDVATEGFKALQDDVEKDVLPSFFVEDDDRQRIEVDILFDRTTGRVRNVSRAAMMDLDSFVKDQVDDEGNVILRSTFGSTTEWFDFSLPDYEQVAKYRQNSAVWRGDGERIVVDRVQFRNYVLIHHLKEWSLRGRSGESLPVIRDNEGKMEPESLRRMYKMVPGMVDVVMTVLERDLMLS